MTMKTTTLSSRTRNGTVSVLAPVTRKPTIGAKSTSMMRSLSDTWTSV